MEPATSTGEPGPPPGDEPGPVATHAIVVFRVGGHWLALAAAQIREIVDVVPAHRVPHRRDRRFVGLVNVRGELVPCIDIGALLGIDRAASDGPAVRAGHAWPRMVLVEQDGPAVAFHVDEVDAVHAVPPEALQPAPADAATAAGRLTQAQVDLPVGRTELIDADLFWYAVGEVWR